MRGLHRQQEAEELLAKVRAELEPGADVKKDLNALKTRLDTMQTTLVIVTMLKGLQGLHAAPITVSVEQMGEGAKVVRLMRDVEGCARLDPHIIFDGGGEALQGTATYHGVVSRVTIIRMADGLRIWLPADKYPAAAEIMLHLHTAATFSEATKKYGVFIKWLRTGGDSGDRTPGGTGESC